MASHTCNLSSISRNPWFFYLWQFEHQEIFCCLIAGMLWRNIYTYTWIYKSMYTHTHFLYLCILKYFSNQRVLIKLKTLWHLLVNVSYNLLLKLNLSEFWLLKYFTGLIRLLPLTPTFSLFPVLRVKLWV